MNTDLAQIVAYKNPQVISHFCHHHPDVSPEQVPQLFADLLAWMWLSEQRKSRGKRTLLFGPLLVLDEVWHSFILHTQLYTDFCLQYFGYYFHHDVEPVGFEYQITEQDLTDFLQDSFQYLGSGWVSRCFAGALVT